MKKLLSSKILLAIVTIYIGIAAWWIILRLIVGSDSSTHPANKLFTVTYGVLALFGGLSGLMAARKWGGRKSLLGRSILLISIGLLLQEFGQLAYSYYIYVANTDVPYPSAGDIGYFGSVVFYVWGSFVLSKALGVKLSKASVTNKIVAFVLPATMLIVSYVIFLKGYSFGDSASALQTFLDFGYPLTQAVYVSVALLAYLLTRGLLGGIMRSRVLLLLVSFMVQYIADFSFLYQVQHETWYAGGWNDLIYATSYALMAIAITYISRGVGVAPVDNIANQQPNTAVANGIKSDG